MYVTGTRGFGDSEEDLVNKISGISILGVHPFNKRSVKGYLDSFNSMVEQKAKQGVTPIAVGTILGAAAIAYFVSKRRK